VGVKQIFIFSENHSAEAMISTDQQTIEWKGHRNSKEIHRRSNELLFLY
jgi:hypothetical protein